ncbi:hypothetical protein LTR78_000632 [Recurvomyces mirabilis]|uniref:Uncharacterized protein n=1 Tax=Recurvomyces mirabilis TaxID=574656 RepID=A0AAE1C6Q3_9PEZI|nr:hypothetical protein LTR78_000632 [Recurvomyces mirabilis]KAK5162286.1 hypothetical protein LTS14_000633 [Recurvomyces mirabilis]
MPPKQVAKVESEDQEMSNGNGSGTNNTAQSPPAAAPSPITVPSGTATPTSTTPNTPADTPAPRPTPTTRPSTSSTTRGRGTTSRRRVAAPKFAGRRSAAARAEAEKVEVERKRVENEGRVKAEAARARRDGRGRGGFVGGAGGAGGERYRGRGRGGYMGDREGGYGGRGGGGGGREGGGGGEAFGVGGGTGGKGSVIGGGGDVMSGPFGGGRVVQDVRRATGISSSSTGGGGAASNSSISGGGSGSRGVTNNSGGGGGSGGGGSGDRSQVKQEPGTHGGGDFTMMSRGGPVKTEDGGYVSSDEDEDPKMNVDQLGVVDLTLGEDDNNGFQPVRIKREEHKIRTLGLNADGATAEAIVSNDAPTTASITATSSTAKTAKLKGKDVEITGASDPFHGTYSSSDEQDPPIKIETTDDGPQHVIAPPTQDALPSPESRRKGKERHKVRALSGSHAPERPVYQTKDELEEWERGQEELRVLYEELGIQATRAPPASAADGDGDGMALDGTADVQTETQDKKADKVYLFQFPPVLPDLTAISVKPDPDAPPANASEDRVAEENGGEAMDIDTAPPATTTNTYTNTDAEATSSTRSGAAEAAPKKPDGPGTRPPLLPTGAVGKLRIHRSGKTTLDWGGTKLTLGMGTTAGFLQDVMVCSLPDRKVDLGGGGDEGVSVDREGESEKERGWAVGMGQVKGKFVVVPDWRDVLG